MVRPVMYWSFAKRSMTSSMDLNMQGNPRARRLASERTLTHGLGQDNQSRAGARRVRGSDGGSARPPRYGLRIVPTVVLLPQDVAARLVLLVTDGAPLFPGDLPVGGGLLAVRLHLLLLRLELGPLLLRHVPAEGRRVHWPSVSNELRSQHRAPQSPPTPRSPPLPPKTPP